MNDIGLLTQKRNSIKEQNQQWISTKKQNQKYAEILAGSKQEHYHARTQHRVNSGFVRFFFFFKKQTQLRTIGGGGRWKTKKIITFEMRFIYFLSCTV